MPMHIERNLAALVNRGRALEECRKAHARSFAVCLCFFFSLFSLLFALRRSLPWGVSSFFLLSLWFLFLARRLAVSSSLSAFLFILHQKAMFLFACGRYHDRGLRKNAKIALWKAGSLRDIRDRYGVLNVSR